MGSKPLSSGPSVTFLRSWNCSSERFTKKSVGFFYSIWVMGWIRLLKTRSNPIYIYIIPKKKIRLHIYLWNGRFAATINLDQLLSDFWKMQTSHHHTLEKGVGTNYQLGRDSWPNINISGTASKMLPCWESLDTTWIYSSRAKKMLSNTTLQKYWQYTWKP